MYVASILLFVAGIAVECFAVFDANRAAKELNYALLGAGIVLLCGGLVLLTLESGGLLQRGS